MSFEKVDVVHLNEILEKGTKEEFLQFVENNNLEIRDGKLFAKNQSEVEEAVRFWDKRQLVTKISLNSLYGALLNAGCRFFDKRIGQSTTLTGRRITRHMCAKTNELFTSEHDYQGSTVIYSDSVTGDTLIDLEDGSQIAIENLFKQYHFVVSQDGGKEYAIPTEVDPVNKVLGYDALSDDAKYGKINYVMRHKTKKKLWRITTESGKKITVTEDHSLIVDRDGFTEEIRPSELLNTDLIITVGGKHMS